MENSFDSRRLHTITDCRALLGAGEARHPPHPNLDGADALEWPAHPRRGTFECSRLVDNKRMLYQAKTGVPVFVPLQPEVADLLRAIPPGLKPDLRYFFWSGNGPPKTYVANWQRSYSRLFAVVDLRNPDGTPKCAHCHIFRDTFAVEMLLAGVPNDQVSILLGHSSVCITKKHYSPWVRARQDEL